MNDKEKKSAFEALRVHYHTFRSRQLRTEGCRKIYGNRSGVKTDLGDLEMEEWPQMARKLIQDSGEQQLQADLQQWVRTCSNGCVNVYRGCTMKRNGNSMR